MATQLQGRTALQSPAPALLWGTWLVASAAGGLIGELLAGVASIGVSVVALSSFTLGGIGWLLAPVLFGATGLVVWVPLSLAQALVLHRWIPGFDRAAIRHWILTSTLAGGGAVALGGILYVLLIILGVSTLMPAAGGNQLTLLLSAAAGGAVLGLVQSAVLRQYLPVVRGWVTANVLGWTIALALGSIFLGAALPGPYSVAAALAGIGGMLRFNLISVLVGTLLITLTAAVTGVALARLVTVPAAPPDVPRPC